MILNTPNNPTGHILSQKEIDVIVDFVLKYKILVLADEIYEKLIYGEAKHISIGSNPLIKDYVITVNGLSKSHAMTGWRVGHVAAHPLLIKNMLKVLQNTITCAPSFIQSASVVAFDCHKDVETVRQEYEKRRDFVVDAFNSIKGFECPKPDRAFYVFPKANILGMDSWQLADYILSECDVLIAPGAAFGKGAVYQDVLC